MQTTITRDIELLAPAKNLACGIAAIDHGADAVYIGADNFGARHAAGNTVTDIQLLSTYAHQYGARVFATVNTVIYDNELDEAIALVRQLVSAGVDAILIQDMGLLSSLTSDDLYDAHRDCTVELHASTQTDNRSADKAEWLTSLGCRRVVLARELSVSEIADIHRRLPDTELEVFVHGALCVSYSGQCYASQLTCGRSANRGACAQLCRMKYAIEDGDGRRIGDKAYYLSLKDQCQIDNLDRLIKAGASSLKIEGRLKDITYVKNVVAAYSQQLDAIITKLNAAPASGDRKTTYRRSSWGKVRLTFTPDLKRSFNRGYTTFFADGRQHDIASLLTPKAIGQFVGRVKEIRNGRQPSIVVAGTAAFVNGDGLCFMDSRQELHGFRVNRADGNRLTPLSLPVELKTGMALYRSQDMAFDKLMAGKTSTRSIPVTMHLADHGEQLVLTVTAHDSNGSLLPAQGTATLALTQREEAQQPQTANVKRQLTKLGQTCYSCQDISLDHTVDALFIPSSLLASLRREAIDSLNEAMLSLHNIRRDSAGGQADSHYQHAEKEQQAELIPQAEQKTEQKIQTEQKVQAPQPLQYQEYTYLYNATNEKAKAFYRQWPAVSASGFEDTPPSQLPVDREGQVLVMQCRYCLRHEMGYCVKHGGQRQTWKEPLTLCADNGIRLTLKFDCKNCQMLVLAKP